MTPRLCTDGTLRHLSVDLDDAPGGDGGETGLTLCSAPERPVWGRDQSAINVAYDMHLSDTCVSIAALPACVECLRVAELLADPDTAPSLHRRAPRQMIAVAASLAGGPPVGLEAAVRFVDDPAAARRVIEAIAIATGHGDRWELTERPTPSAHT